MELCEISHSPAAQGHPWPCCWGSAGRRPGLCCAAGLTAAPVGSSTVLLLVMVLCSSVLALLSFLLT